MSCPITNVVLGGAWCSSCSMWRLVIDVTRFPPVCDSCFYDPQQESYIPEGYYFQDDADGGRLIKITEPTTR